MELTATNRPRAWPKLWKTGKWKDGSAGRTVKRTAGKATVPPWKKKGSMFVGRMKDVYVVLKAYGTGRRSQTGGSGRDLEEQDLTMPEK